ncbi:MAG: hypothetical protein LC808_30630 [Actinobacteria bacterium]|nr:hypothetical protein [Actinomycetota bacterium]
MPGAGGWIWNKGLAALCDHRIPDEFPEGSYSFVKTLAGNEVAFAQPGLIDDPASYGDAIRPGDLVWVRGAWLPSFIEQVLPLVGCDFVLVTGDTDSSIPSDAWEEARLLLQSGKLIHWFTQNYDTGAPPGRLSPIPIGLDLHTIAQRPMWGEAQATPAQQEAVLDQIVCSLPPRAERIFGIYVDYGASGYGLPFPTGARLVESRRLIREHFADHPLFVFQDGPLPRSEMWRRKGRYLFSLSPHGKGLDCHRTWESLALGQVVLVPSSSLDPVFEGTRAVPIAAWGDIDHRNLERWAEDALELAGADAPLRNGYWLGLMRDVARASAASAT